MKKAIQIKNLKKSFDEKNVLNRISLDIHEKEIVAILGRSGSGKSVLLKSISGLITPDAGKIIVMEKNIGKLNEEELIALRRKVGYLFQEGALYDSMNVHDNLAFPLKRQLNRPSKEYIEQAIEQALKKVGLEDTKEKIPSELSGGMKKE
jgi:phospholipid/cholesterol/gamma-HCH transport system ATP-binding protein